MLLKIIRTRQSKKSSITWSNFRIISSLAFYSTILCLILSNKACQYFPFSTQTFLVSNLTLMSGHQVMKTMKNANVHLMEVYLRLESTTEPYSPKKDLQFKIKMKKIQKRNSPRLHTRSI